ncbi:MAG: hypothetical protein ACRCUI_02570 [Polymorphobacter sp.]
MNIAHEAWDVAAEVRRQIKVSWWLFALRGVLALVFAAQLPFHLNAGLGVMSRDFVVYALADGTLGLVAALWGAPALGRVWLLAAEALASFAAAVMVLTHPALSQFWLVMAIATRCGLGGVMLLMSATRFAGHPGLVSLVLSGLVSILLTATLFAAPFAGLAWRLALYLLVFGALMVGLSMQLRRAEP